MKISTLVSKSLNISWALIIFFLISPVQGWSQQFKVADGPISNTTSDSRSVNFFDINNDGWEDIYISNGLEGGQKDFLYINNGAGEMEAVTNMEIVELSNPSDGGSFADYNNDGHIDGLISSWHGAEDVLYINNGNGSLNYNANAGIVSGSYAETAAFGDYDNDGWLDLYVTNSGGSMKNNFLYRNLKNGKFELMENHSLVSEDKLSRGATWVDYDNDNILDLFIANEDNAKNDLYRGLGGGQFEKINDGAIVNSGKGSMTASWADIDNDGDLDLFVGNAGYFQTQKNQLFRNTGNGFVEITSDPVTQAFNCTFGSAFADYDNDGDLDLLVSNGFCNSGLDNGLYANDGLGNFEDVSAQLPDNGQVCSFGVAWGDVNNDGFPDAMIANCKNNTVGIQRDNKLLINQGNQNHWLKIKLAGTQSNKDAIGARVRLKATINGNSIWQIREVSAQTGYAGQNSSIAHFGLGGTTNVDSVEVIWPAGGRQYLTNVTADQLLNITEPLPNSTTDPSRQQDLAIKIFPNPTTSNEVVLQLSTAFYSIKQELDLAIYDSLGQLVLEKELQLNSNEPVFSIDLSKRQLAPGTYIITVTIDGNIIQDKLIIQ